MESLSKSEIIAAWHQLGHWMQNEQHHLDAVFESAQLKNAWFTPEMVQKAFTAMSQWLHYDALNSWSAQYQFQSQPKKVGLILAGNIPLVGLHDILCVLLSGNIALIKRSSDDANLTTIVMEQLIQIEPKLQERIQLVERLQYFDAVIATGSNNSSRYFDYYFGKVPHIIRKNRHSIAVLNGEETEQDLVQLGHDIFDYYGLGCRNVSKIFIPKNYEIKHFFEPIERFNTIINHHKFVNNYDYNKSIYLVNVVPHFDNGFLLLKEDEGLSSPLSVVFYEYYQQISDVETKIKSISEEIQCVVSNIHLQIPNQVVKFGQSQCPTISDYADDVDTMRFLESL